MNMTCDLYRNPGEPWGFRLQGGTDYRAQLGVKKVTPGSPAARSLRSNDEIITINNVPTKNLSHRDAEQLIRNSGNSICLTIRRGDDPLADYRPDGPIKFNVQRAQQVQQAMGIPAANHTMTAGYSPAINGYAPSVNGYGNPVQNTGYPWPVNVTMQSAPPQSTVQYSNYY